MTGVEHRVSLRIVILHKVSSVIPCGSVFVGLFVSGHQNARIHCGKQRVSVIVFVILGLVI